MAHIVATDRFVDQVLMNAVTLSAASTAMSFTVVNPGRNGMVLYAATTGYPPGSASTAFVLSVFPNKTDFSAQTFPALASMSFSATAAILMMGIGVAETAAAAANRRGTFVPRDCTVVMSYSTAAASADVRLTLIASFF